VATGVMNDSCAVGQPVAIFACPDSSRIGNIGRDAIFPYFLNHIDTRLTCGRLIVLGFYNIKYHLVLLNSSVIPRLAL
jgi:hypothetical protein